MRHLPLLCLLICSSSVQAEWIEFSTRPNGDVFFYDDARVTTSGADISVWTRVRYKTSVMAASSFQALLQLDCDEHTETVLRSTFFTDRDWTKAAMATNMNAKPAVSVSPNSTTARLMNIVCPE